MQCDTPRRLHPGAGQVHEADSPRSVGHCRDRYDRIIPAGLMDPNRDLLKGSQPMEPVR